MNYKTTSRIFIVFILFGLAITEASAQVVQKIGSNSFTINPKAVLELESTTKGFLPPRMTTAQQNAMGTTIPEGLIIFVTDGSLAGLHIWKGSNWITLADAEALEAEVLRAKGVENINIAAIALNTAKIGITTQQAADITANNAKTGITAGQASEIAANTLKVGITTEQATAITANTAKVGITTQQALDITTNNAKIGITTGQASEIAANTLKVGITTEQATAITENTVKVGITTQQASDITANNAKTGITAAQASEIAANTLKVGITTEQATAITANVAAILLKEDIANKSTDIFTDKTSDVKFPSVKAVKTYVDVYSTFNAISTITASYTATISDYTILCNNNSKAFQLTLPAASTTSGKIYVIRKTDESTNILTISPALKLTESTAISSLDYPKTMRVQSNGADWYIID